MKPGDPQAGGDSVFLRHGPCPNPECGSSDANSIYSDGHEYCFSCGNYVPGEKSEQTNTRGGTVSADFIQDGEARGISSRKISQKTADKFNYHMGRHQGEAVQIAPYYDENGRLVAQKCRTADKEFYWIGSPKEALPFGSRVWAKTGKKIVVTEGEIDAMAMSQVQGNKYPVVSIACGAGPQVRKYIARHKEYFNGFEEVILMFDQDEIGQQAAQEAAEVIGMRSKIATLPLKDAGDMLVAGRSDELINAMWKAEPYRPEGIVSISSLKDEVLQPPEWGLSWPFPELTEATYGIRLGEIYALGAGTGIGKTDFFTQTMAHMVEEHGKKIGVFSLEQEPKETAVRLLGKMENRVFHIPEGWTVEELEAAWDEHLEGNEQIYLYDSFGVNEWEAIRSKIEYLYHNEGVQHFFLDHLTALAGQQDERKALDNIMSSMGGLVKQIPVTMYFISHLATPQGTPHEEGGRVMIRHFRGSRAIGFWSHFMFGMERNQQADDPEVRSTTTFRILKDRYTGRSTGHVFYLGYDHDTGMLHETVEPDPDGASGFGFEDETKDDGETDF